MTLQLAQGPVALPAMQQQQQQLAAGPPRLPASIPAAAVPPAPQQQQQLPLPVMSWTQAVAEAAAEDSQPPLPSGQNQVAAQGSAGLGTHSGSEAGLQQGPGPQVALENGLPSAGRQQQQQTAAAALANAAAGAQLQS